MRGAFLTLILPVLAFSQSAATPVQAIDSSKTSAPPIQTGTLAGRPAACSAGQIYLATDQTLGMNQFLCSAANRWSLVVGTDPEGNTVLPGALNVLGTLNAANTFLPVRATGGDDTHAINTALVSAAASGRCVLLPDTAYRTSGTIAMNRSHMCLVGFPRTMITYSGTGNAIRVNSTSAVQDWSIRSLKLVGPGPDSPAVGIMIDGGWFGTLEDLWVTGFGYGVDSNGALVNRILRGKYWANGVNLRWYNGSNSNDTISASFQGGTKHCIVVDGASGKNSFYGGDVQSCGGTRAMLIQNSVYTIVDNVWFESNTGKHITIQSTGTPTDGNRVLNSFFVDLGIEIMNGQGNTLEGNYLPGTITVGAAAANTYVGRQSYFTTANLTDHGSGTTYLHDPAASYVKASSAKGYTMKVTTSATTIGSDTAMIMEHLSAGGLYRAGSASEASASLKMGYGSPAGSVPARSGSWFVAEANVPFWKQCCADTSTWFPSFQGAISVKSADYTLTATDASIVVDTSAGDRTVALPLSPETGRIYRLKKLTPVNHLILSGNGKTIDGQPSVTLTAPNSVIEVQYDGQQWQRWM